MKKDRLAKLSRLYGKLEPFYKKSRKDRAEQEMMFQNCVRASFAKAYEFNVLVNSSQNLPFFFLTAGLRSICDDLILLKYLSHFAAGNRNNFIQLLMMHKVLTNLKTQQKFFAENRPFQLVLPVQKNDEHQIDKVVADLQAFWKTRGWTLSGKAIQPQIRQLAERRGIAVLYDFIYRITSDVVHFNPQVLLRSGWGEKFPDAEFSTKNFEPYYKAVAVIYGSFLFCVYFELLHAHLKPMTKIRCIVAKIKAAIHSENRWPELVTFEEMNLKPPHSPILHVLSRIIFEQENPGFGRRLLQRKRPVSQSG